MTAAKRDKKSIFVLLVAVLSVVVMAVIWMREPDKDKMLETFLNFDHVYLIAALVCMCLYVCMDGVAFWAMAHMMAKVKISLGFCLKFGLIGRMYNSLTPFATGGQPYYVFQMAAKGVKSSMGTSIIVVKYIMRQAMYMILAVTATIVAKRTADISSVMWVFIWLGLAANVLFPLILLVASKHPGLIRKIIVFGVKMLSKMKLMKRDTQDIQQQVSDYLAHYREGMKLIFKKWDLMLILIGINILEIAFFLLIPYVLRLGFGPMDISFWSFSSVYYLLFLAIAVMPTPGGAGFAEGGFFILFSNLFAEAAIVPAVLLWRGITYYLLLFCGGITSVIDSVAGMSKKKKLKANPDLNA